MPYIGKKPADIIATVIDTTTGTFSGEVDAGSLDVSGNADIDGITNLDNTDIDGTLDVSGNLTVDTNTLFVDSANNRVGVGTVSPSVLLHLDASSDGRVARFGSGTSDTGGMYVTHNSGSTRSFELSADNILILDADRSNGRGSSRLQFNVDGSERMRIDSSGNLLVGTTSSNYAAVGSQLGVGGSNYMTRSNAQPLLLNRTTSDGDILLLMKDSTTVGSIGTYADFLTIGKTDTGLLFQDSANSIHPWNIGTNGASNGLVDLGTITNKFKDLYLSGKLTNNGTGGINIDTSGNVGIGTSSPSAKLHIDAGASTEALRVEGSGAYISYLNTTNTQSLGFIQGNDTSLSIAAQGSGNTSSINFNAGGTERMRIDSSGLISLAGDTDTGWSLPTANQQQWTCGGALTFKTYQIAGAYGILSVNGSGSATYPNFTFNGDDNTGMFRATTDTLAFTTGGSERMRIDSSGNVGIGTSSPNVVSGYTNVTINGTTGGFIDFENSGTHNGRIVGESTGMVIEGVGSRIIKFHTNSTERMRIDSSGNLLVGTTSSSGSGDGIVLGANDQVIATRNGAAPLWLNRRSNEGDIVLFNKDGATVGSISVENNLLNIGSNDVGIHFDSSNDFIIPWNMTTNSTRGNAIDLGSANYKFKDLYLSGGVYLGGTGSGNLLNYYDEGNWTPSNAGDATGTVSATGKYVIVGRLVTLHFAIRIDSNFTSNNIGNLPVQPNQVTSYSGVHGIFPIRSDTTDLYAHLLSGQSYFQIHSDLTGTAHAIGTTDGVLRGSIVYQTS